MKKEYSFEEKIAVEEALKALYQYNNACRFPVEETYLDTDILEEYFLTDDEQLCKDIEKRVGSAAIQFCYDNPDILRKKQNALLMSTQMTEALHGAKIEADFNLGKLGKGIVAEKKREALKRENAVVQKSVFLANAKKTLSKMPLKMVKGAVRHSITPVIVGSLATHGALGATIAAGSVSILGVTIATPLVVAAAVGVAMSLTYEAVKRLTPKPIREKVKAKAKEMMAKSVNVIEKNVERFRQTPVGKKVSTLIRETVAPVVSKGIELMENAYKKVKTIGTSIWTKAKSLIPW